MTIQQKTIMTIIQSSADHPTADDIFVRARQVLPSIALATVYRNLSHLVESGQIRRIVMHGSADRFDQTLPPHEHLTCAICGSLSDITLSDLRGYLTDQTGYEIIGYELNMTYICPQCQNKKEDLK